MNAIYSLYRSFVEKNRLKKRKKEAKKYAGYGVVCEICGSEFRNFAPFGITQRENARCHLCNSLERHRLIYKYFNEKTTLFRPNRKIKVLHFAPENFLYNILSQNPNIEYIPCDINPKLYKYRGKTKIVKVDITDIPFDDNCFDVIICNHVLEHVIDDKLAMSELYRVMKSGGWGMFQIPMSGWGYFPKSIYSTRSFTF